MTPRRRGSASTSGPGHRLRRAERASRGSPRVVGRGIRLHVVPRAREHDGAMVGKDGLPACALDVPKRDIRVAPHDQRRAVDETGESGLDAVPGTRAHG